MNKITKASIAAGAAVLLLMGGGGTLAYWNAGTTAGSATITAGELKVSNSGSGAWSWTRGTAPSQTTGAILDIATFRAVPGDTLTFTQEVTVTSSGNNLKFEAALAKGTITAVSSSNTADAALAAELINSQDPTVTLKTPGTNNVTQSGSVFTLTGSGTSTLVVTVTIQWPFGANPTVDPTANDSQTGKVSISNTSLTLTQVQ